MLYVDLIIMMDDVLPSLRLSKFSDCAARHQYEKQEYREDDVWKTGCAAGPKFI